MGWTTRLLVVANRTADSDGLLQALQARAEKGPIKVTLIVPQDTDGGQGPRLLAALSRMRAAGIEAEGMLGDTDAVVAVQEVWNPRIYDEIIVSTLPAGVSRWLGFDVPRRIARLTDAPVTHLEATEAHPYAPIALG